MSDANNAAPSIFLFKAKRTLIHFVFCILVSFSIYVVTLVLKFKNPEHALYMGGLLGMIALLNYFNFQFCITVTGITFCSYKTLFQVKYLPIRSVSAYSFDKPKAENSSEISAEIYDLKKNIFASFVIGKQDSDFVAVMQQLDIPRLGAVPKSASRETDWRQNR